MAYNSGKTSSNNAEENFDRHLKLENPLSSDRKPVKIGNDSTGLLLEDNKVIIEDTLTVDGEAIVKDLTINNTLKLSANPADYATLIVADTGDLTIATVGDGTTDSDIKLHADGNIILTADSGFVGVSVSDPDEAFEVSGNIKFTSDGQQLRAADGNSLLREASNILYLGNGGTTTTYIYGNTGLGVTDPDTKLEIFSTSTQLKLSHNAADYATFTVADTGDLTIATVGDGDNDSDLTLDADGSVILDPNNGKFIAKSGGTEFSAENSAYAGMILGYTDIGLDESAATYNLTTGYVVPTSEFKVTFKIPPSGNVEIEMQIGWDAGSSNVGDCFAGLSDNASYNAVDDFHEVELFDAMSRGALRVIRHSWTLTGLSSVGDEEEIWVGFKTSATLGTPHLQWGGDATGEYPDFIMKATALPATIAT